MKICVLSHARCRSSILVTSLANAYNIHNRQEEYDNLKKFSYKERQRVSRSLDKKNEAFQIYTDKVNSYTDKLFSENNDFVIKVWPRFFNTTEFCYNFDSFLKNLETSFKFKCYDKIILSNRDSLDSVCSLSLGIKYGYNYNDEDKANLGIKRRYANIQHHKVELHDWNKSFIIETLLINNIRSYFDKNKISYDFVPFSDIPSYVSTLPKNQLPPIWHLPIDTKIDYSKAVVNYDALKKEVEEYKEVVLPRLNNIIF